MVATKKKNALKIPRKKKMQQVFWTNKTTFWSDSNLISNTKQRKKKLQEKSNECKANKKKLKIKYTFL